MRKERTKGFVSGLLTALILVSLVGTALATSAKVNKEIEYRNITVTLDGKKLDLKDAAGKAVEPFMMDGTNYLPVRALAESLGLTVAWNGSTNTVVLTSGQAVPPSTPQTDTKSVSHTEFVTKDNEMVIIFQNNTGKSIPDFEAKITFYDANGKMLTVEDDGHDAVLPNAQVVSMVDLPTDSKGALVKYAKYDVNITIDSKMQLYENLTNSIRIEDNKGAKGVVARVTNNSAKMIDELELVAVYYKDGVVVGAEEESENDIGAGKVATLEFSAPMDASYNTVAYDSYKIFVNQAHNFGL